MPPGRTEYVCSLKKDGSSEILHSMILLAIEAKYIVMSSICDLPPSCIYEGHIISYINKDEGS